ncbi:hypothetical protein JCM17843_00730 [Kordiimonadales bacterium JCM 17843]|nr:hypothetical protein JCM17843_00730 [Kordiimonadales bacterium JCM 17843]
MDFTCIALISWGMSALYNKDILRLATEIPFTAPLADAQISITRTSRICGSRLRLDAIFDDQGRFLKLGLDVRACALGQATTAIVAPKLIGLDRQSLAHAADDFRAMLQENGPPPAPPFEALHILEPVRDHKSRHASVMLIFDAALAALDGWAEKSKDEMNASGPSQASVLGEGGGVLRS